MGKVKIAAALALTVLLMALLGGCLYINIGGDGKTVVGSGKTISQEAALSQDVTGLRNESSIDVVIDPSLSGKAVIEGDDNLIGYVELSQNGDGLLTVKFESGVNISFFGQMRVRIPAIAGGSIVSNGSGDISLAEGTLKGSSFDVSALGSGDISLALEADAVSLSVSGSGDITVSAAAQKLKADGTGSGDLELSGTAQRLDAQISGSGGVDAFGLEAGDADVHVSGSGSAHVAVTGSLTGGVYGSGDLVYSGDPASVKVDDNGSGDVHQR
jgi:hypothetical protein